MLSINNFYNFYSFKDLQCAIVFVLIWHKVCFFKGVLLTELEHKQERKGIMEEVRKIRIAGDIMENLFAIGLKNTEIKEVAEYLKQHARASMEFEDCELSIVTRELNLVN